MANTRKLAVGLLALLLAAPLPAADDGYLTPSLVRLWPAGDMDALAQEVIEAGWDPVARMDGGLDVMLPRRDARQLLRLQRVRDAFGRDGTLRDGSAMTRVELLVDDADAQLRPFDEDAGIYHTYAEVRAAIDALEAAHPEVLRQEVIGTTVEGRPIVGVELTGPGDASDRPAALITGLHHAREWISVEVPMEALRQLATGYGQDPWVTEMLDTRRVWVVPVVNPDGLIYSQTERRMWRKNRSHNKWWSRGVDPNRNYGHEWGGVGSSGMPFSDTYRGPEAFSEPETQAIRDLALREGFVTSLSFHSYSQLVLWPWGHTYDDAPHEALLRQHGEAMAAFNGYEPMSSSGLYRTTGDFTDWFYGELGAISYTFELGTRFVPREEDVPEIVAKNWAATRYFLEHTTGGLR